MDKMICKICGNELQKEGDSYICQKCGCEYTADLSGIVSFSPKDNGEIDTSKVIESVSGMWSCVPEFNSNADNQIYAKIVRIGHLNKEIHGQQIVDVFEDGFGNFGCGYEMEIYNISGEKIKYFTVFSKSCNKVGDDLGVNITRFTGPVEVGKYYKYWTDGIWDDKNIGSAKIVFILFELFDGKKILYSSENLEKEPENLDVIRFTKTDAIPRCKPDSKNKIYLSIVNVCHQEVDFEASKRAFGQLVKVCVEGCGSNKFGIQLDVKYLSGKPIKSIDVFIQPLNSVLDKIGKQKMITVNGPISVGDGGTVYFELWNHRDINITNAKIKGCIINFTDETSEFYKPEDLSLKKTLQAPPSKTATEDSSGGCYVATAVYGSYDCPQVWTLRRYRDNTLASTWYGRVFIRIYYSISPTLVKWFGHTKWFKKMWKGKLDSMVEKLQENGVESTPYKDKEW